MLFYFWSDQFLAPPDCAFYWAWADALLRGPTLNFMPAIEALQVPAWYAYVTETGRLANDWPMGTGLLILPAAWAGPIWAHAWLLILMVFVLWLWWSALPTDLIGPKTVSLVGLILGTPLLFYSLFGPFFSHVPSFIIVTAFLVLWSKDRDSFTACHWLKLGILLGIATLVRPQNIILGIVFLPDLPGLLLRTKTDFSRLSRQVWMPFIAGVTLGLAPRFPAFAVLYGNPFSMPKLEEMQWFNPNIAKTLFSDYHGIIPWTPIYVLALAGLIYGLRTQLRLCLGLLLVFAVQLYVNAANEVWWSGGSFGNRRLTDYSIVVAWGLLMLLMSRNKAIRASTVIATVACSVWTFTLLLAERRLIVPLDRYVPFSSDGFLRGLANVYLQPVETWRSLTRAVDTQPVARLVATAVLFVATVGFLSIARSGKLGKLKRRGGLALSAVAVGLIVWVSFAAINTPPVEPALRQQFAESSAILWDNYTELAGYHLVREDFNAADEAARKAIGIRPDAATGYWYSGVALLQGGHPAQAAERFQTVLRLDPAHHNAGELLQIAETAQGKPVSTEKPADRHEADWRVK